MWNRTYGGQEWELGHCVLQTEDGGYILLGSTRSYGAGERDIWLIKTNPQGDELWNMTFGGSKNDSGTSVLQTDDGGYVVAGRTESYGSGKVDIWLIKIKADSGG